MKIIKDNILIYFGDRQHDYRSFMSNPIDLQDEQIFIPRSKMIKMEQTAKDIIVEVNEAHAGFGFLDHTKEIAGFVPFGLAPFSPFPWVKGVCSDAVFVCLGGW